MAIPKDLGSLNSEEGWVVRRMWQVGEPIKPHRSTEPLIMLGNLPICTWPTLFSLLGRDVLVPDEATGGYALAPAWMKAKT